MKVQTIKLDDIKPYWRNPRKNEKAVEAVKQSIQAYGFNQPIILDTKKIIIAGHTRYKALLEMGWTEAPCVVIDLPVAKAKEYRIADNKTSELAELDMTALIPELREI
jgi:ParB family chromosome partitioning protein